MTPDPQNMESLYKNYGSYLGTLALPVVVPEETMRAVVAVVSRFSGNLEISEADNQLLIDLETQFMRRDATSPAEVEICLRWIRSLKQPFPSNSQAKRGFQGSSPCWGPVQAFLTRSLAGSGQRAELHELLGTNPPTLLADTEVWLEAGLASAMPAEWPCWVEAATDDTLAPETCEAWKKLLLAEGRLAGGDHSHPVETTFRQLAQSTPDGRATERDQAEGDRVASRAAAALVRLRVATGSGLWDVLSFKSFARLPAWERAYLRGWVDWRDGDLQAAENLLREAVGANPWQNCVRLSLAALVAVRSAEEALSLLEVEQPSADVLISQAALCVRLGQLEKAELAIAKSLQKPGSRREPLRHSLAKARLDRDRQRQLLIAGLAEWRGRWLEAGKAIRSAPPGLFAPGFVNARLAFSSWREMLSTPSGQGWRRHQAEQKLLRHIHDGASIASSGDELFLKAMAMSHHTPDEAIPALNKLIGQAGWVAAQRRLGGDRLLAVSDLLLSHGRFRDATHVFEVWNHPCPPNQERMSVAGLAHTLTDNAATGTALEASVSQALGMSPDNPKVLLLAALGMALNSHVVKAAAFVEQARQKGASPTICDLLESLSGLKPPAGADVAPARDTSKKQKAAHASLILIRGSEPPEIRAERFVITLGDDWVDCCPVDPRKVATLAVASMCDTRRYDEAVSWIQRLGERKLDWARELGLIIRIRRAMAMAGSGQYDEAERELKQITRPS